MHQKGQVLLCSLQHVKPIPGIELPRGPRSPPSSSIYLCLFQSQVFFAFFMRFNADIVFKRDLLVAFQRQGEGISFIEVE